MKKKQQNKEKRKEKGDKIKKKRKKKKIIGRGILGKKYFILFYGESVLTKLHIFNITVIT